MIGVTRLDGSTIFINEENVQWIESMPDTAIIFLGGARVIVRDTVEDVLQKIADAHNATKIERHDLSEVSV